MTGELNSWLAKQPLLLFDGECGLCNRAVQFLLKREKKSLLHFAPLQSAPGTALRKYFEISDKTDSLVLIKNNEAYIKSCAALRLTKYMKGLWPLMMVFLIIPPFLRNLVYDFIARCRTKWFGKVESCALLKQEDRSRFLAM